MARKDDDREGGCRAHPSRLQENLLAIVTMVRNLRVILALMTKIFPPDYSLTGVNAALAVEKGLAEADWYTTPVPKAEMRKLLQRRNGPAIRDTRLVAGPAAGFWLRHGCALGHLVGGDSLPDLCRALRHQFGLALARMRPRNGVQDRLDEPTCFMNSRRSW